MYKEQHGSLKKTPKEYNNPYPEPRSSPAKIRESAPCCRRTSSHDTTIYWRKRSCKMTRGNGIWEKLHGKKLTVNTISASRNEGLWDRYS